MTRLLPILIVVGLVIGIYLALRNAATVARVRIEGGKVDVARGRLSSAQRRDLQQAVHLSGVRDGRIRLFTRKGGLGVSVSPSDEGLEQRLLNTVGTWKRP